MSTWFGYERTLEQQKIKSDERYNMLIEKYSQACERCKDREKKMKYAMMCKYIAEAKSLFVASSK